MSKISIIRASPTFEDFTAYTKVDPNNHISTTATHIDFLGYRDESAYLYADKGINHFGTVWEHRICIRAIGNYFYGIAVCWALANLVGDLKGIKDAHGEELVVDLVRSADGNLYIRLYEEWQGSEQERLYVASFDTAYYLIINRNGTALSCKIYGDSSRTDLLSALSLTLNVSQPSHRYIYASQTYNSGDGYVIYVGIDSLELLDTTPPNITDVSQNPPKDSVPPENEVKVNATVTDDSGDVKRVTLVLAFSNGSGTWIRIIEMTNIEGNVWNATIPSFPYATDVSYTIMAEDNTGNINSTEELEYRYQVIPEFQSFIIVPIFMMASVLTLAAYKTTQTKIKET
jgi:hypothetical protein